MDFHSLFGLGLVDCKSYICVHYLFSYDVAFASYYLFFGRIGIMSVSLPVWKHDYLSDPAPALRTRVCV